MGNKTTHSTYTPVTGLHGPTGSPGIGAPSDADLPLKSFATAALLVVQVDH